MDTEENGPSRIEKDWEAGFVWFSWLANREPSVRKRDEEITS